MKNLINYDSRWGRLAALKIGEEYDLGHELDWPKFDGQIFVKIQHASFVPAKKKNQWDSRKTEYKDKVERNPLTIKSLREALRKKEDSGEPRDSTTNELMQSQAASWENDLALLQTYLEGDSQDNITEGIIKEIRERLTLPDQHTLDEEQDAIFRLPLAKSLFLLGPAGTGKTTTLIRRLHQKQNFEEGLNEWEQELVKKIFPDPYDYIRSWVMFTPSDLLKSYLQEAFNRENIVATNENLVTWLSFSNYLGRDILRILRTSNFESGFFADENILTMRKDFHDWPKLFQDFNSWLFAGYIEELKTALENAQKFKFFGKSQFPAELFGILSSTGNSLSGKLIDICALLFTTQDFLHTLYKEEKKKATDAMNIELGKLLRQDKNFLQSFSNYYFSLKRDMLAGDDEGEDIEAEIIAEDDDEKTNVSSSRKEQQKIFHKLIAWLASRSENFDIAKSKTLYARLAAWLGNRAPSRNALKPIGETLKKLRILGRFSNPLNRFFNSIAVQYGKFRKLRQAENLYYHPDSALRKKISFQELDLLILIKLKLAAEILRNPLFGKDNSSFTTAVRQVKRVYKAQVFVDEAPDFSPIQLCCMKLVCHPEFNSFFACGDFNQRLTIDGTQNVESLKSFLPEFAIEEKLVSIPYRQTKTLNYFSQKVLESTRNEDALPDMKENEQANTGFKPALGENLDDRDTARWLVDRILEIEGALDGKIPSTAILVPSESHVSALEKLLKEESAEKISALIEACHDGKSAGDSRAIRIFDIRHIKGLEFEAAFFVSLEKLAAIYPGLIGNYLYVGATRAAQFLGISCEGSLPREFGNDLRSEFVESWNS